jgi:hypothetical protein
LNTKYIYLALAVFVILVSAVLIRTAVNPTGFAAKENAVITSSSDAVVIDKSELKLCCEFMDSGVKKGCWVLNRYDCGYCAGKCGE